MNELPQFSDPEVLATIQGLELRARQVAEGLLTGLNRSPFRGHAVDFAEHREYSPGDDLRRLDWRTFGRTDRYFIKQFESESNLRCTFVLDASASMAYGSGPLNKYLYASTLVASLSTLLLGQRDHVRLIVAQGTHPQLCESASTVGSLKRLCGMLEQTEPRGPTHLVPAMRLATTESPSRGLTVIISDWLTDEPDWESILAQLRFRGDDVVAFQLLDRDELEFPFEVPMIFQDIEGTSSIPTQPRELREAYVAELALFLQSITAACHRQGVDYSLFRTDQPLSRGLSEFLYRRARMGRR